MLAVFQQTAASPRLLDPAIPTASGLIFAPALEGNATLLRGTINLRLNAKSAIQAQSMVRIVLRLGKSLSNRPVARETWAYALQASYSAFNRGRFFWISPSILSSKNPLEGRTSQLRPPPMWASRP